MSTQTLATIESKTTALALGWSPEDVTLIKDTVCKGSTDHELRLFLYTAKKMGLDPLAKQIHAVKRWDSKLQRETMAIQVGIDGYRLTAQRSNEYNGQDGPFWCGEDGEWKDQWLKKTPPVAAKVMVYRKGIEKPFVGFARYDAYVQSNKNGGPNSMWAKMPDGQLAKCAEALAMRKAFPQELGGTLTDDEMHQADSVVESRADKLRTAIAGAQKEPVAVSVEAEFTEEPPVQHEPDPLPQAAERPRNPNPFPIDETLTGDALKGKLIVFFGNDRKIPAPKLEVYLDTPRTQWSDSQLQQLLEVAHDLWDGLTQPLDYGFE